MNKLILNFFLFFKFISVFSFELKTGDLLFQDLDGSSYVEAIEKVTFGYNNYNLSHIGIYIKNYKDKEVVLETSLYGVVITDFQYFLRRSFDKNDNPKVLVGRVKEEYSYLINNAINFGFSLLNKPYDKVFDINNDKYYCSELIYFCFKHANNNEDFFYLEPMTFINPYTNKTFEIWENYFESLNIKIPEKELGINPAGISLSDKIDIIYKFGNLTKKE